MQIENRILLQVGWVYKKWYKMPTPFFEFTANLIHKLDTDTSKYFTCDEEIWWTGGWMYMCVHKHTHTHTQTHIIYLLLSLTYLLRKADRETYPIYTHDV